METIRRLFLLVRFGGMSTSKRSVPDPILGFEVIRSIIVVVYWCGPIDPKLVYRYSKIVSKLEVRMRLSGVYRMSKDGDYTYSVSSYHFLRMSISKRSVPDPILGVEVARCSIGVVRGVVQVVQNWFTGIKNPTRSLRLG